MEAARVKIARQMASSCAVPIVPPTGKLPVFGPMTKEEHDEAAVKAAQQLLGEAISKDLPPCLDKARAAITLFSAVSVAQAQRLLQQSAH